MSKKGNLENTSSKNSLVVIIAIPVILLIALIAFSSVTPKIPDKMNLEVKDLNDQVLSTKNYSGNYIIIEFMATWCSTCEQITDSITSLYKENQVPSDVIFMSISIDPTHDVPKVVNKYITDHNLTELVTQGKWVFGRDVDKNSLTYKVSTIPTLFLLGKDLKILDQQIGLITKAGLSNWINETQTLK